jgi:hypothetical protein
MPQVGFETTIPVFVREKTVNALDHAIGVLVIKHIYYDQLCKSFHYRHHYIYVFVLYVEMSI